jgi:RHS repeat-associated protein
MSGTNNTPYGTKGQWGYYTDGETGLLLLTHRYLDPATGMFLTRDPSGFEGGINLYAYVGNGVVVLSDSRGLQILPKAPCPRKMPNIRCSTLGGVIGLPKTDPAYRCAQAVCQWWARQYNEIDDLVKRLCDNVIDCFETNNRLPPVPKEHPCWREGGSDSGGGNFCCVECVKRVCAWFEQPSRQLADRIRDSMLRRCWQQYHGAER